MSSLDAPIVENSCLLAEIYFIFLKNTLGKTRKSFYIKFGL